MILTFEHDLNNAKMNHRSKYLGRSGKSFSLEIINVQTHTHTHTHTHTGPVAVPGPLKWSGET